MTNVVADQVALLVEGMGLVEAPDKSYDRWLEFAVGEVSACLHAIHHLKGLMCREDCMQYYLRVRVSERRLLKDLDRLTRCPVILEELPPFLAFVVENLNDRLQRVIDAQNIEAGLIWDDPAELV